jgi:hypothetical protein
LCLERSPSVDSWCASSSRQPPLRLTRQWAATGFQDLRDAVALEDEHSHVDVAVRRRIGEIILEIENEELTETGRRLVERLGPQDLAQLVADWLDTQTAI